MSLAPDGQFRAIFGCEEFEVNSLHWQAIDRLAPGLVCEAVAPDGTIEGVRVEGAKAFAIGVQWHPELSPSESPHGALLRAFVEAARAARTSR